MTFPPQAICKLLHTVDPYDKFDHTVYVRDLQGWNSRSPAFQELITELRPHIIIEVGTWKGASAIHMASKCRELRLPTEIICVDTWLGAIEFWMDREDLTRYKSLRLNHGYPSVYYQFLANVCHCDFQDIITPFPQTSSIAAAWFEKRHITADLIYIDGSHEERDVHSDLHAYWPLLRPGGVLFGDDYEWAEVRKAVDRFAQEIDCPVSFKDDKWIFRKPTGT
jgi:hypothetical protein